MEAPDYIEHLQKLADEAKAAGSDRAERKQKIADYCRLVYQHTNGQSLEAVFMALPLMVEIVHSVIAQYDEEGTAPPSKDELDFLLGVKMGLVECVSHINTITNKPSEKKPYLIGGMTEEEIAKALESLPTDKNDA